MTEISLRQRYEGLDPMDIPYRKLIDDTIADVQESIAHDVTHQVDKYGYQRVNGRDWVAILVEEFGESTQAYLQQDYDEAIKEIKQTIACFVRFAVEVQRERDGYDAVEADLYVRPQ